MAAGDKPLLTGLESPSIPDRRHAAALLELYFDVCHATYRPLHRPTIKSWHEILQSNEHAGMPLHATIGKAKAAVLLGIFAVSTYHSEESLGLVTDEDCLLKSDSYFKAAMILTDEEVGLPKTESVQARLIQVFYLLMTCRMNQAWYVFGNVLQLISALGLHTINSRSETRSDYIATQCRRRVFWTSYILDKYIGTLLGRPMHFHDEDVNIDFPDCVNDEDMTSSGPGVEGTEDCQMDAFVMNARLARIVGKISRKVYPMHALSDKYNVSTLRLLNEELEQWRSSLPALLGTVRPSSLVPSFRRQNVALRIAYYHAVMHTNRSSLLRLTPSETLYSDAYNKSAIQCVHAAMEVLKIVDRMAKEGPLFHAFWWTHFVTFCALSVAHVWQVQRQKCSTIDTRLQEEQLSDMMGVYEAHLAHATAINSASRRYCIILKELKAEATRAKARQQEKQVATISGHYGIISEDRDERTRDHIQEDTSTAPLTAPMASPGSVSHTWLDEWTATDWLDLDASASFRLI
ncbi:hypothetical protein AC578_2515 [Pseudocercospora eumusae]|uniref:Xylanolytic transcriptional activator regulatory domain-containing protein n=1 Tax=Pseudocercospora eumusae TaxID=321146 RepID=A0A139GXB3_9PEZI|nr:hypothetical protein AC578_2515 [Pseudocercospora eumusae]